MNRLHKVASTFVTLDRGIGELEHVVGIRLTLPVIIVSRNIADYFVSVQANWTNKVHRLAICQCVFKLKNHRALGSLVKLIFFFLVLKFVLLKHFFAERFERHTKLHIHHISSGQISGEGIKQSGGFSCIWGFASFEKTPDRFNRVCGLACCANSRIRQAYNFANRSNVHTTSLQCNHARTLFGKLSNAT